MGGIRRNRNRRKGKAKNDRDNKNNVWDPKLGKGYKDIVRENDLLESFYREQKICDNDEELNDMIEAFKRDLPASFRVTGFRSQAIAIRNLIESKYIKELIEVQKNLENDAEHPKVEPKCLSWYPDRMAWQLNLTRRDIRRVETYFKLHNFLISETESGNISRQETVSMIPPLVLDVKPHHKVLDMCAAPGSKTAQLIEAIHADENVIPEGIVVANDADNSRCYMLVHQAKRLQSPNVAIINHDASILPNIQINTPQGNKTNLKFSRILCDVPCSGDGTLRKNPDIWSKWNAYNSCNLHGIQFRIAKRALELLEVGGRIVYSTCSLNPIEDEAVLDRILTMCEGTVELVDISSLVPGLKYKPGLKKWKLMSKDNEFYSTWDEVPEVHRSLMRPYMFPSGNDSHHLERCIRVLPHQQDTGGFFVAALVKKSLCPWESQKNQDETNSKTEVNKNGKRETEREIKENNGSSKKPRYQGFKEDPFNYLEENDKVLKEVMDYFDIKDLDPKMFFTRSRDSKTARNHIYFSSLLIRNIIENNVDRIKIINSGVKAFSKCENKGATVTLRLAQEGSLMTLPFVNSKIIHPTLSDLDILLQRNDCDTPPQITEIDPDTQKQLSSLNTGSIALIYDGKNPDGIDVKLELVGWRGKNSIRAYVPKNERIHYLRLIGGDTSKYEKNKFELRREGINKSEQDDKNNECNKCIDPNQEDKEKDALDKKQDSS